MRYIIGKAIRFSLSVMAPGAEGSCLRGILHFCVVPHPPPHSTSHPGVPVWELVEHPILSAVPLLGRLHHAQPFHVSGGFFSCDMVSRHTLVLCLNPMSQSPNNDPVIKP